MTVTQGDVPALPHALFDNAHLSPWAMQLLIYFAVPMCWRQGVTVMKGLTLLAGLFV